MNDQERDDTAELLQNMVSRVNEYGLKAIKLTEDLPYFAGIFDTEVYFAIGPGHGIHLTYDKHNEDLLKIFSNCFGGEIHKDKPRKERKRDIWVWHVKSKQAYEILKKVHPFLRIKREKARLCIECYEKCAEHGLTRTEKAKIGEYYVKLLKDCKTKPEQRFDYSGTPHLKLAYLAGMFDVGASFVITRRTEPGRNSILLPYKTNPKQRE